MCISSEGALIIYYSYHNIVRRSLPSFSDIMNEEATVTSKMAVQFPSVLREMLEYADRNNLSSIVSWVPNGRAFKVHNEEKFMTEIAGLFFRATKIRSIYRQLYFWSFRRIATGVNRDAWFHESFVRDRPVDMLRFVRSKIKTDKGTATGPYSCTKQPAQEVKPSTTTRQTSAELFSSPFDEDFEQYLMSSVAATFPSGTSPSGSLRAKSTRDFLVHEIRTQTVQPAEENMSVQRELQLLALKLQRKEQSSASACGRCMDRGREVDPTTSPLRSVSFGLKGIEKETNVVDEFALFIQQTIHDPFEVDVRRRIVSGEMGTKQYLTHRCTL